MTQDHNIQVHSWRRTRFWSSPQRSRLEQHMQHERYVVKQEASFPRVTIIEQEEVKVPLHDSVQRLEVQYFKTLTIFILWNRDCVLVEAKRNCLRSSDTFRSCRYFTFCYLDECDASRRDFHFKLGSSHRSWKTKGRRPTHTIWNPLQLSWGWQASDIIASTTSDLILNRSLLAKKRQRVLLLSQDGRDDDTVCLCLRNRENWNVTEIDDNSLFLFLCGQRSSSHVLNGFGGTLHIEVVTGLNM